MKFLCTREGWGREPFRHAWICRVYGGRCHGGSESCGAGVAIGGTGIGKNNPVRYVQAKNAPNPRRQFAVGAGINGNGSVVGTNTTIVYPTIVVPKGWDGKEEFTQRFYKYLDAARQTNGSLPRFLDDPTNEDYNPGAAEQQLGYWAQQACRLTGECPKELDAKFGSMAAGFLLEAAAAAALGGPRAGGLGSCTKNSFTPDTKVLLADGTTKPIKDVRVGDKVLATDPKTGRTYAKTVTAEIKGQGAKRLVKVTIDTDGKKGTPTSTVTATDGHPFWVPALNEWLTATSLKPGQWLRTSAGTHVQITAVTRWAQQATVYNLTVADVHTYYVLAGATPVLVHNCGGTVVGHPTTCDCVNGATPKVRNGKLAGGVHPNTSVPFDRNGFPDFSAWRHPQVADVRIQLTGSRSRDFRLANQAAGLPSTPTGYTWHHHQDPGLMQLIQRKVHADTGHTGGF